MATLEEYPVRREARKHITVHLDEGEWVPTQGDRRGGTARDAVIVSYHLEYDWDFGQGAWTPNPWRSAVSIRQRLNSGDWGDAKRRRATSLPDTVFAEYRPVDVVTFATSTPAG